VPGRPEKRLPAYQEHARSYSRNTRVFQTYRRAIVDTLPLSAGDVVLDVGCGTGLCCGLLRAAQPVRSGQAAGSKTGVSSPRSAASGAAGVPATGAPRKSVMTGAT
jgi:hypothetical protein